MANDTTPNNFPADYNQNLVDSRVKLRSSSVRNKTYGVDVREAIAQGVEIGAVVAKESLTVSQKTSAKEAQLESRFNNVLANNQDVSEVVDARLDQFGQSFSTLAERLNYIQNPFVLQLSGLSFEGTHYPAVTAFKYNYGAGYAQSDDIELNDVEEVRVKLVCKTSDTCDLYFEKSDLLVSPEMSLSSDGKALYLIDETNNKNIAVYIQNDCVFKEE